MNKTNGQTWGKKNQTNYNLELKEWIQCYTHSFQVKSSFSSCASPSLQRKQNCERGHGHAAKKKAKDKRAGCVAWRNCAMNLIRACTRLSFWPSYMLDFSRSSSPPFSGCWHLLGEQKPKKDKAAIAKTCMWVCDLGRTGETWTLQSI